MLDLFIHFIRMDSAGFRWQISVLESARENVLSAARHEELTFYYNSRPVNPLFDYYQ